MTDIASVAMEKQHGRCSAQQRQRLLDEDQVDVNIVLGLHKRVLGR